MRRGVLRANIDHELIISEERNLLLHQFSVLVYTISASESTFHVIFQGIAIVLVEVLAQRIAFKVLAQVEAAHIWMSQELNAQEIEDLTFQQISALIQIRDSGQHIVLVHLLGDLLHRSTLMGLCVFQNINTSQAFLAKILADNSNKVVEMFLVFKLRHLHGKAVISK